MHILGIDPGTGRTGWGVVDHVNSDKIIYIAHGCIITTQEDLMEERLKQLHNALKKIIKEYKPSGIVVEQIFFGLNARTAISVSQARGVILLTSAQENISIFEYTPLAVKYLISGSGKTDKKEMQKHVRTLLNLDETTLSFSAKDNAFDDAADALAIAIHHIWKSIGKENLVQKQKVVDEKKMQKKKSRKR